MKLFWVVDKNFVGLICHLSNSCFVNNFLESITKFYMQELEALLGGRSAAPAIAADAEEVNMTDFEESPGAGGFRGQYYDEDDDHPHTGGQHVQCAHQ